MIHFLEFLAVCALVVLSAQIGLEQGRHEGDLRESLAYRSGLTDGARRATLNCPTPRKSWQGLFQEALK